MSPGRRLAIDWIACNGYGLCAVEAPDLIVLDDWGYPVLPDRPVPHEIAGQADRAIRACPMAALAWRDRARGDSGPPGRPTGGESSRRPPG